MSASGTKKLVCVVGARPNFMKIAPILRACKTLEPALQTRLVHTGQHYSYAMNEAFFEQLEIPTPDVSLNVGPGSQTAQVAEIMKRFEPVLEAEQPAAVLVVGDVNSTLACGLVAAKMQVKLVHVEAGLRSRDRSMPEELNRVVVDQLSDRLYVTERGAITNLQAEGIPAERSVFVGNVMIDTLRHSLPRAVPVEQTLRTGGIVAKAPSPYGVLTLHRPSNVDDPNTLRPMLDALAEIARRLPLVFPVHPRTQAQIQEAGLGDFLRAPGVLPLPPVGYLEMLGLMHRAKLVVTDSGGLQEETTALGVPCLTLRKTTERPITITEGTNTLVGVDPARIRQCAAEVLAGGGKINRQPELWDGHAATRIVHDLAHWLKHMDTQHLARAASPAALV